MFFTTIKKKERATTWGLWKVIKNMRSMNGFQNGEATFTKLNFLLLPYFFFFLMTLPQSQPPVMLLLGEAAVCAEKRVWRNSKGECCKAYLLILYVNLHMSFLGLTSEIHLCDPKYSRKDFEIWTKIYALPESQTNT